MTQRMFFYKRRSKRETPYSYEEWAKIQESLVEYEPSKISKPTISGYNKYLENLSQYESMAFSINVFCATEDTYLEVFEKDILSKYPEAQIINPKVRKDG